MAHTRNYRHLGIRVRDLLVRFSGYHPQYGEPTGKEHGNAMETGIM